MQLLNLRSGTTYSQKNPEKQNLEQTDCLLICKALHSLRMVEQFCCVEMMRCANKQMNFPIRARLRDVIITCVSCGVPVVKRNAIEEAPTVSLSCHLWISSGALDILPHVPLCLWPKSETEATFPGFARVCRTNRQSLANQRENVV